MLNNNSNYLSDNLFFITNNLNANLGNIGIRGNGNAQTLKIRNFISAIFHKLFTKERDERSIQDLLDTQVSRIQEMRRECFVKENGEVTELFLAIHRYNQCIQNTEHLSRSSLAQRVNLVEIFNQNVPELCSTQVRESEKELVVEGDQPEIMRERRLFFSHNIRRYPGDRIDHSAEATSIFLNTQKERFLSLIGRVIEVVGRFFGCRVRMFQRYHYRSIPVSDEEIYSNASPMVSKQNPEPTSYWLGHASLLLNIPLRSNSGKVATFNVITDPVEGDLNKILYPRQTKFARPMEKLPAVHIYLLSHNHLDHFDEATIRKLLSHQPMMVVPSGDGNRYTEMGFRHVIELDWWEKQTIELIQGEEVYQMKICATPARHWAGQGPCGGHESTFLGYVIEGVEEGDIYFAGDTATLSEDHVNKLRDHFNIKWNFQPGGPDELRADMESTHQASVDALWMHFNLMVKKLYREGMSKGEFMQSAYKLKTIYMHTMTYKLGNLHLTDTVDGVSRILWALEGVHLELLKDYELRVLDQLKGFGANFKFSNNERLALRDVICIIENTVAVPKIGSRIGLRENYDRNSLFLSDGM